MPTIVGELKRYFRDHTWAVRVPRDLQEEHALKVQRASAELTPSLGRSPTPAEIAETLDTTVPLSPLRVSRLGTSSLKRQPR